MPSQIRLYYELNRLHKFPAGIILVFWPCAWALTMAAYRTSQPPAEFLRYLVVYAFSGTLVHSAACVLNDICDRDLDRRERTMNRPLACGAISLRGAIICLLVEVTICIAVLGATGSLFTFLIGFLGIFPLHGLYPLMKRVTFWPQAWLGLAMNWGFIVVWIHHVKEDTYTIPAIFFLGTVCWTIVYDTIYGCQDRVDDVKAGVKSTSLLFGNYVRPILTIFATAFLVAMTCAGYLNHQKRGYYTITVGGTALHLAWQLVTLKENEPADCWRKFQSNGTLGFIAFIGMAVDYVDVVL
ncbi:4-hydroxybenzoate polyprenyltransferase, mitochondrial [Hypsizygus marmoreus]|uniref:4-hydroxybenzoate polyprenyltransferase, mitochondrial n=1 Tax=Hypsizygus marmoreus TaxID=39966 RepID=A0A369J6R3_HYPMA|nr:4-hydroxybenzoate polyprenyltransferase, mitochondrial [Hypsizygus marmoreus]